MLSWSQQAFSYIYTDASDYQLGAVIMIILASSTIHKKLHNFGKKVLSIYETFKEFWSMLLGAKNTVHIDHKKVLLIYQQLINE